jgi:hypothetical protein
MAVFWGAAPVLRRARSSWKTMSSTPCSLFSICRRVGVYGGGEGLAIELRRGEAVALVLGLAAALSILLGPDGGLMSRRPFRPLSRAISSRRSSTIRLNSSICSKKNFATRARRSRANLARHGHSKTEPEPVKTA